MSFLGKKRESDKSVFNGKNRELGTVCQMQFFQQLGDVIACCAFRNSQFGSDFLIGKAVYNKLYYVLLAACKIKIRVWVMVNVVVLNYVLRF